MRRKRKTMNSYLPQALSIVWFCFIGEIDPGIPFPSTEGCQLPSTGAKLPGSQADPTAACPTALCRRAAGCSSQTTPRLCGKLQGVAQPQKAEAFVLVFQTLH